MNNINGNDEWVDSISHYGTPRHSGRYPWGSGDKPYQRNIDFQARNAQLKREGYSEHDRAEMLGCRNVNHLRAKVALAAAEVEKYNIMMAQKLKDKGYSNVEIAKRMGTIEGNIRNYLKKAKSGELRMEAINKIKDVLKEELNKKGMLDVGEGTELYLGVSPDKLKNTLELLKDEGYHVYSLNQMQQGTGKPTTMKILCPPDKTWHDMQKNRHSIEPITDVMIEDDGYGEVVRPHPPVQLSRDRVYVRYAEDGGADKDGTIELRRGVDDLDIGKALYAQVRVAVDNGGFMKGMAFYSDDMPDGYDVIYNTNKKRGAPDEKVFKPQKTEDPINPFGAAIKPGGQRGALNICREEGDWSDWSKSLASQFLSKQPIDLARKQLTLTKDLKQQQYDDILSIDNPVLRKKMLKDFAEECDADAVALKATAMPRQATHAILPVPDIKENEIYAPNYRDGENVVLIRYPHGGKFEIPELTVNNKNKSAKSFMENAKDAVGIHPKTAAILSGADFDGDTVLVIPNNDNRVKTINAKGNPDIESLRNFDTKSYAVPEGQKPSKKGWEKSSDREGKEMGIASNLITDMTLGGASLEEIIRATKYSMVVIDTGKHKLDWNRAYEDFGIKALKDKYQGHLNEKGNWSTGANTLISRSKGEKSVEKRSERYDINPETGEKIYLPKRNKQGEIITGTQKSTQMAEARDARELLGPNATEMEKVYADYANAMKTMGNKARLSYLAVDVDTKPTRELKDQYSAEIDSLSEKLTVAKKNAPLERKAQLVADQLVAIKREANPDLQGAELSKVRGKAIVQARQMVGAGKKRIVFTDKEWEALTNGAVSKTVQEQLFNNANQDSLMSHAFPKGQSLMTPTRLAVAKSMLNTGHSVADVADYFGVSASTINNALREE